MRPFLEQVWRNECSYESGGTYAYAGESTRRLPREDGGDAAADENHDDDKGERLSSPCNFG
jgi:hypothetical protein